MGHMASVERESITGVWAGIPFETSQAETSVIRGNRCPLQSDRDARIQCGLWSSITALRCSRDSGVKCRSRPDLFIFRPFYK